MSATKNQNPNSKVSPKERDQIRSERNNILKAHIERQNGVSDCRVSQLDDHTDNGYLLGVTFDDDTTSAAELVSVIRSSLNELFPDIPVWGEMKTESDHSVGFAYVYIDAYNKRFPSS